MAQDADKKKEMAGQLAAEIFRLARDSVLVHLRFLDVAVSRLKPMERWGMNGVETDGASLFYDPLYVLRRYQNDTNYGARLFLHMLLHCIFSHSFQYGKLEAEYWDLAADIAVENTIQEMGMSFAALQTDAVQAEKLRFLKEEAGGLTAERIYRYFKLHPLYEEEKEELRRLFSRDRHTLWRPQEKEELVVTQEMWKKISERVRADLKSFSKGKTNAESLEQNLNEAVRERYDYGELLRRFTVMGETVQINEDEFDYIYYTYGLARYGNMPLIEPLEYKDERKVREFIIALDTSASCRGPLVRAFLRKTYSILKGTENFFHRVNVHIIQCDNEVRSDIKITENREFDDFLQNGKLMGFGSTDFRPVFTYVDELLSKGEFEDLKGLIYFTDGYGTYPERMPGYDVIFAFLEEDGKQTEVPSWAIKVILDQEELEKLEEQA